MAMMCLSCTAPFLRCYHLQKTLLIAVKERDSCMGQLSDVTLILRITITVQLYFYAYNFIHTDFRKTDLYAYRTFCQCMYIWR